MAGGSEHVFTNAVQTDNEGTDEVSASDHQSVSDSTPGFLKIIDNKNDLPWLLAAVGTVLASILGLRYIAPGFLAGLLAGTFFVILAQLGAVWIVWEKVRAKRDGQSLESKDDAVKEDGSISLPVLERQGSVSHEGYVWIATKPAANDWPKSSQRGGRGPLSPPGWAPQKRHAKLHFNMLMLGGPNEEKTVVKLDGCDVRAVSANGGPERKWSKKFPISIRHAERTLFSNSHELLIYCATGFEKESWCNALRHASRLHVPEKPSVIKTREDYLAFVDLVRQLAGGGEDWLAPDTPGKEHGNNSGIGKWRAKLRRRSKGRFTSWGSAEEASGGGVGTSPGARGLSPPRKGDSDTEDSAKKPGAESGSKLGGPGRVRSFLGGRKLTFRKKKGFSGVGERSQGSSMGESVLSEDDVSDAGGLLSGDEFSAGDDSGRKSGFAVEGLGAGGAEEAEDASEGKVEGDNIIRFGKKGCQDRPTEFGGSHDGGIRFCNVMFARIFFDMARNTEVADMIKARIERKLARLETPTFMGSLRCTHFDLGTKPPLARAMRVLPSTQGVSVEVDFEYRGGAKLTFETRLDMRAYANTGLFKNLSDKPGAEKAEELVENAELIVAGVASKGLEQGGDMLDALAGSGKPTGRKLKGNFHSAMTNVLARLKPVVQHVTEQVSMVPLTLTVTVLGLEGTARLRLGPPPTDRLWFGFSDMPDLELESRPSVGQLNITRNPLAAWMVERLRNLLRESLVYPQGEDITIPYMMNDPDELYHGDPPPAWKRTASDVAPPVSTPLASPSFPAPGTPSGALSSPGGGGLTPQKVGGVQSPGPNIPPPDLMWTPPRGGPPAGVSHPPAASVSPLVATLASAPDPAQSLRSSTTGKALDSPTSGRVAPTNSPVPALSGGLVPGTGAPVAGSIATGGPLNSLVPARGAPTALLAAGAADGKSGGAVSKTELGGPSVEAAGIDHATAAPPIVRTHVPTPSSATHAPPRANLPGSEAGTSHDAVIGAFLPGPDSGALGRSHLPGDGAGSSQQVSSGPTSRATGANVGPDHHGTPEPPSTERQSPGGVYTARGAGSLHPGDLGEALVPVPAAETEPPLAAIGEGNESGSSGHGRESHVGSHVESLSDREKFEEPGKSGSTGRSGSTTRGEFIGGSVKQGGMGADDIPVAASTQPTMRDPFPPAGDGMSNPLKIDGERARDEGASASSQQPSDPWDLVAQAGTAFPQPAAPDAFRNRSAEQPRARLEQRPVTHSVVGRLEGAPEEQDRSSGSDRSLDSAADVAGGRADVGANNRKAMVLDYGKKIGLSFRDKGRKYLEKGRLGSLLNRPEGAEGQPHQ